MRISFKDIASVLQDSSQWDKTFVFVGAEYPYPAAQAFAEFLAQKSDRPLEFFSSPVHADPLRVSLFSSQEEKDLPWVARKNLGPRVVPFLGGVLSKTSDMKQFQEVDYIIEVPECTESSLPWYVPYMCTLMGVEHSEAGIQLFLKGYPKASLTDILTVLEYARSQGGLRKLEDFPPMPQEEAEVSYLHFRDTFLFKTSLEMSTLVERTPSWMEFTSRLLGDLTVYTQYLLEDQEGKTSRDISEAYRLNEWFLRTRLLPRLRSLGVVKLLRWTQSLIESYNSVFEEGALSGQTRLAVLFLLGPKDE